MKFLEQQNDLDANSGRVIDVENHDVIELLKEQIKKLEKELEIANRNTKVDYELIKAGAKNPICVRALLNLDSMEVDAVGNIVNLQESIDKIKNEEPYLFYAPEQFGRFGSTPADSSTGYNADPFVQGFMNF